MNNQCPKCKSLNTRHIPMSKVFTETKHCNHCGFEWTKYDELDIQLMGVFGIDVDFNKNVDDSFDDFMNDLIDGLDNED